MADGVSPYPLWQRRFRRSWRRRRAVAWPDRRWVAAAVLLAAALLAGWVLTRPARPDPRRALPDAEAALGAHRWTAARDAALRAVAVDPRSVRAQLVLARAQVELGEGVAGEAALGRAEAAGASPAGTHALRAAARLLQGDGDGALAEAGRADGRDAALAGRVRARALAAAGQGAEGQAALVALLARFPQDAAAWTDLGRLRLTAGDVGGAADAAAQAVALGRHDPAALTLRGEVIRARFGLRAALPWFDEAVRADPGFHPALIERAATLGDLGRYREMLAATRAALLARPGSPQALYLQAVLAARSGRPALARGLLAGAGDALDDLPGAQLLAGALALEGGHGELAASTLRDLVGAQPGNLPARRLLGAALLGSGDAAGALDALRPLAVRADADVYTLDLAARAAALTGDRAGAAAWRDRAASGRAGPAAPFASEVGVGTLQAAVAERPDDPGRALALIRGLLASGAQSEALAAARGLAAAGPGAPAAWRALGDVLLTGGDAAGAASAFARGADLRFDEPGMLRLVDAYGRSGRGPAAAAALATDLSQNPDSVLALQLAGHWQVAGRQWAAAVRSLERARARVGDRDAALLADLARAYAGAGRIGAARAVAAMAYRLAPAHPAVVGAYAEVLRTGGDADGARQMRDKLARLGG